MAEKPEPLTAEEERHMRMFASLPNFPSGERRYKEVSSEWMRVILATLDAARARIAELEAERGRLTEKQCRAICHDLGIDPDKMRLPATVDVGWHPTPQAVEAAVREWIAPAWTIIQHAARNAAEEASDG